MLTFEEVVEQIILERQRSIDKYGSAPEGESFGSLLLFMEHALFKARADYYSEPGDAAAREEVLKVLNLGVAALRSDPSPR